MLQLVFGGVAIALALVGLGALIRQATRRDTVSVSERWIAQYRSDPSDQ